MSEITILLLYLLAAIAFAMSRLPQHAARSQLLLTAAFASALVGLGFHAEILYSAIRQADGLNLSIASAVSLIGFQLALISLIGGIEPRLRGMSSGLLALGAIAALALGTSTEVQPGTPLTWQIQAHILISMFAYGLLTAGAIVAVYALLLDRRLRSGRFASGNPLFAPLETTEKMLFGVAAAGFAGLLLAVVSGFAFVDNLFAQHLVHKTALSLLALTLFGILLGGRLFAGWRSRRAIFLYLWGFLILCLAYFGSRFILEELLGRTWG